MLSFLMAFSNSLFDVNGGYLFQVWNCDRS